MDTMYHLSSMTSKRINSFFETNTDPWYDTVEKYVRKILPIGLTQRQINEYIDVAENNILIHKLEQMEL